jgi:hypothetical protein
VNYRQKLRALDRTRLRRKNLIEPCRICGKNDSEVHHTNYDTGTYEFLCNKHHPEHHRTENNYERYCEEIHMLLEDKEKYPVIAKYIDIAIDGYIGT